MTRFFCHMNERWPVTGSDINPNLSNWCAENLEGVTTVVNGTTPPLPFGPGSFDLVYSLSIFTHLNQSVANAWLEDIGRVMAPGGILIVTTHGYTALETIRNSAAHQSMFSMTPERVAEVLANFAEVPFGYQRYQNDVLAAANAGEDYGNAFIHPRYIQDHWNNETFRVLEQIPAGLRGWQDVVVLQRRGSSISPA